jgi:hypothetical protein
MLDQLHRLLFAIRAIYHAPNPYHNYVHAVDVLQATYTFLVANGVAPPVTYLLESNPAPWMRESLEESDSEDHENARLAIHSLLRPQDILTIMIGAMGHDVGHPGLSNVFMVCLVSFSSGSCTVRSLTYLILLPPRVEKRKDALVADIFRHVCPRKYALHSSRPAPTQTWIWIPPHRLGQGNGGDWARGRVQYRCNLGHLTHV